MRSKEEIEQLANKYSSLGQAAGLSNREYTLENIAYRRGYEQCQEDMADEIQSLNMKVKTFDNVTGDTLQNCNDFLQTIDSSLIISITPLYNTILGGVIYVVFYNDKPNKQD